MIDGRNALLQNVDEIRNVVPHWVQKRVVGSAGAACES